MLIKLNKDGVVKYTTIYNKNVDCDYVIDTLKEFDGVLQKLNIC